MNHPCYHCKNVFDCGRADTWGGASDRFICTGCGTACCRSHTTHPKVLCWSCAENRNTAANRISNAKWRNAHPVAVWAHQVIHLAIKKGFLRPLNGEIGCVDCEREAQHYDHRDYLYPLTVEPVCYYCNFARGRGKNHGLPADHIPATPARYLDDVFGSAPRQKQSEPEQSTAATEQAA